MTLSVGALVVNREEGCGEASQGAHSGDGDSYSIATGRCKTWPVEEEIGHYNMGGF